MKKFYLIILLILVKGLDTMQAQRAVLSSGGDATGSGGSASYSIGQTVYTSNVGSNGNSNQGVQQPYEFFSVGIDNQSGISLSMTAYPNPTNSVINLVMDNSVKGPLTYEVYDANGKLILTQDVIQSNTIIPMEQVAMGNYILNVSDSKTLLKSFTIIKNQ